MTLERPEPKNLNGAKPDASNRLFADARFAGNTLEPHSGGQSGNPIEPHHGRANSLPDLNIHGGDTNVTTTTKLSVPVDTNSSSNSGASARSNARGGEGGHGGDGGKGGSGFGGGAKVGIDNSTVDKSMNIFRSNEATQAITPGTAGASLDVTFPAGRVKSSVFGPQSSSAFNLNLDAAAPGIGGGGIGIGTTHTGEISPEVKDGISRTLNNADEAFGILFDKSR